MKRIILILFLITGAFSTRTMAQVLRSFTPRYSNASVKGKLHGFKHIIKRLGFVPGKRTFRRHMFRRFNYKISVSRTSKIMKNLFICLALSSAFLACQKEPVLTLEQTTASLKSGENFSINLNKAY